MYGEERDAEREISIKEGFSFFFFKLRNIGWSDNRRGVDCIDWHPQPLYLGVSRPSSICVNSYKGLFLYINTVKRKKWVSSGPCESDKIFDQH